MAITQQDIIYFILTDRFYGKENPGSLKGINKVNHLTWHGGNFDGIIEKIPYLQNLGITALWITPVYLQVNGLSPAVQPYHGYWTLDFNQVDPHLYIDKGYPTGSKQYLKDLADALHQNGIKLILDVVVNHAGYNHPGLNNDPSNPTPIRAHWFNREAYSVSEVITKGELSGLPDFNLDHPDVIDYHIQSILSWIRDTGVDGIRMDTAKHVEKGFWNYFKTQVRGLYPDVSLIGEVLVFDIDELTNYQKYWGFDSLFDFPVQQAINRVFLDGESLSVFHSPFNRGTGIFERDTSYSNHNRLISLLDNHDLPKRFMTGALDVCSQDREKAIKIMKLALTFLFTTRGIPSLYYGTEIGMEGRVDPDNRREFCWDKIGADQEVKDKFRLEKELFCHTKDLIRLRKITPALFAGSYVNLFVDQFLLVWLNYIDENVSITAIHNGWDPMPTPVGINILQNPTIPGRIKEIIKNRTFRCGLSGKGLPIQQGKIDLQMEGKSSHVFIL